MLRIRLAHIFQMPYVPCAIQPSIDCRGTAIRVAERARVPIYFGRGGYMHINGMNRAREK